MSGLRYLILLIGLGWLPAGVSHAQTVTSCPPGMVSYGAGVCGYDQSQGQAARPQAPDGLGSGQTTTLHRPPLASGWMALVHDKTAPIVAEVTGMRSRREAEQAALKECQAKGGTQCEIEISMKN